MKLMPIEDLKRLPVKAGAFFYALPFHVLFYHTQTYTACYINSHR